MKVDLFSQKYFRSLCMALIAFASPIALQAVELDGQFIQGGMVKGKVPPGSEVFFSGKPVRVSKQGQFVIGFGRDSEESYQLAWTLPDGSTQEKTLTVSKRKYQVQEIEGVAKKYVSPPEEVLARISNDNKMVRSARKRDDDRTDYLIDFIWPTEGPVTGVYGSQRIFNGEPRRPHFGLDIAGPVGQVVVAPAGGIVSLVHNDMYFSGGTLIVDHGHGISSTFIHLSKILVKEDDVIKQGQPIAEVGKTGRVTGAHLDWRVNWFTVRLDPRLLLPEDPTR